MRENTLVLEKTIWIHVHLRYKYNCICSKPGDEETSSGKKMKDYQNLLKDWYSETFATDRILISINYIHEIQHALLSKLKSSTKFLLIENSWGFLRLRMRLSIFFCSSSNAFRYTCISVTTVYWYPLLGKWKPNWSSVHFVLGLILEKKRKKSQE